LTRPTPLPVVAEVKLIQGALLVVVHVQVFADRMLRLTCAAARAKRLRHWRDDVLALGEVARGSTGCWLVAQRIGSQREH
jgi:hypothetical protein